MAADDGATGAASLPAAGSATKIVARATAAPIEMEGLGFLRMSSLKPPSPTPSQTFRSHPSEADTDDGMATAATTADNAWTRHRLLFGPRGSRFRRRLRARGLLFAA
jgi:hypothetical protein